MPDTEAPRKLQSIQAARGLAALAVVVYHTSLMFEQRAGFVLFRGLGGYGYLGVPFFFVLSGFIIGHAHFADLGYPRRVGRFLGKRFQRVYPIYWVLSAMFIVAALAGMGEPDFSYAPAELLQAHLLVHVLPSHGPPPLKVAWTLFYEVRFYLVFALAIVAPRATLTVAMAWMAAIVLVSPWDDLSTKWLSYWNLAFPIGLIACALFRRLTAAHGTRCALLGGLLLLAILITYPVEQLHGGRSLPMTGMMAGFALVILGVALREKGNPLACPRSLLLLGDASYSLYLAHSAVISLAGTLILKLDLMHLASSEALYLAIVFTAMAVGIAVHLLLERPLLAALRSRDRSHPFRETARAGSMPGFDRR